MNKAQFAKLVLVVAVSLLAACNRKPQPSVSPLGSWQGTLTVMKFPSPILPFAAEITAVNSAETEYEGVFTLDDASYDIAGYFAGSEKEGERFIFEAPLSELQAAESPVVSSPPGLRWSGLMTEDTYQGNELQIFQDNIDPLQIGEFVLRRP